MFVACVMGVFFIMGLAYNPLSTIGVLIVLIALFVFVLCIAGIYEGSTMSKEEKEALERQKALDKKIVMVKILSVLDTKKTYDGIFSDTTHSNIDKIVFSVKYASGRIGIESVSPDSARFQELAKFTM